jgi:hypothetical protein
MRVAHCKKKGWMQTVLAGKVPLEAMCRYWSQLAKVVEGRF